MLEELPWPVRAVLGFLWEMVLCYFPYLPFLSWVPFLFFPEEEQLTVAGVFVALLLLALLVIREVTHWKRKNERAQ
jgi:hypothetical protein